MLYTVVAVGGKQVVVATCFSLGALDYVDMVC